MIFQIFLASQHFRSESRKERKRHLTAGKEIAKQDESVSGVTKRAILAREKVNLKHGPSRCWPLLAAWKEGRSGEGEKERERDAARGQTVGRKRRGG